MIGLAALSVAAAGSFSSGVVVITFGFLWVAAGVGLAGKRLFSGEAFRFGGADEGEVLGVGAGLQKVEGLIANGHALAAGVAVAVVVADLTVRTEVDDGLAFFVAGAELAFPSLHGDRAELDALDGLPRLGLELDQLDAVETGLFKGFEEALFGQRAGDAAAPERRVVHQVLGLCETLCWRIRYARRQWVRCDRPLPACRRSYRRR